MVSKVQKVRMLRFYFTHCRRLNGKFKILYFRIIIPISRKQIAPVDTIENEQRKSLSKKLLTYNGKKMVFTVDEETNVYFKELNDRWNK